MTDKVQLHSVMSRVPHPLWERLMREAARTGVSGSDVVKLALDKYLQG